MILKVWRTTFFSGSPRHLVDRQATRTNIVLHPSVSLFSRIKTLDDYANPCVLHQKYVIEKLSASQIAGLTGASKTAVLENLRRLKVPLRPAHKPQGRHGNPRFGYRIVSGRLVKHPEEQRVIASIKQMHINKLSLHAIARQLNLESVPTRMGKGRWYHEQVRAILKKIKKGNV